MRFAVGGSTIRRAWRVSTSGSGQAGCALPTKTTRAGSGCLAHGRSTIAWVLPGAERPDARVEELLAASQSGGRPATVLRDVPLWQLENIVTEAARREAAALSRPEVARNFTAQGPLSIYLICDRTDAEDTAEAVAIGRQIENSVGSLRVHLPETGRDPAILDEFHQERLLQSDAVLFYVSRAQREFVLENYGDMVRCLRRARAGKPYRASALLLGPGAANTPADFAALGPQLSVLTSLEPFIAALKGPAA